MVHGIGGEIGKSIAALAVVIAAVCFALGAFMAWAIPKTWEIAKPFIHAWTS